MARSSYLPLRILHSCGPCCAYSASVRNLWPSPLFLQHSVNTMAHSPRRPSSAKERAEAAFKSATTKPAEPEAPKPNTVPTGKELVSIRIDRDVLAHFQDDGPGWQERINSALRKAAQLD